MSISYLAMALRTQLPKAQKLVLLCLAESCNDWGFCTPGHKYLSFKCCISVRTVIRTLQELTDAGYIIAKKVPGQPTVYQIRGTEADIPAITPTSLAVKPEIEILETKERGYPGGVKLTKAQRQGQLSSSAKMSLVSECHQCQNVTSDRMAVVSECHYSLPPLPPPDGFPSDSLSLTPPISPHSPSKPDTKHDKAVPPPYSDAFLRFWAIYPRREGKGQAYKAWLKLNPSEELVHEIIEHVSKRKVDGLQWTEQDGKYIPHPSTFLNGSGWEDDYKRVTKKNRPDDGPQYKSYDGSKMPWE